MDANRFDTFSRVFARRRLSRREAMITGGAALAATGLAASGLARPASAQEATPETTMDGGDKGPELLFVQTFQAGSIAPKEGVEGRYTLTLEAGAGQTIYFSDRPDRIVGAAPTAQFLETLGFPDDNPPNAALVVSNAAGETDIAVIELFSPVYDEATQGLTYEIEVLENWAAEVDMEFREDPTDLAMLEPTFGTAHLFIDGIFDCPDADLVCFPNGGNASNNAVGTIPNADHNGFCVVRPQTYCLPCKSPDGGGTWADECNRRFAECNGDCTYSPGCTSAFYGQTC